MSTSAEITSQVTVHDAAIPGCTEVTPKHSLPLRTAYFELINAQSVCNKSVAIDCMIYEGRYNVFLLIDTWHTTNEEVAVRRCAPPGYICLDVPRTSTTEVRTNHVVAAIVTDRVSCKVIKPSIQPTTFESLCITMAGAGS